MSYKRLHIDNKTMKIHKLSKKINRERNRKIEPNILELKIIINGLKKNASTSTDLIIQNKEFVNLRTGHLILSSQRRRKNEKQRKPM